MKSLLLLEFVKLVIEGFNDAEDDDDGESDARIKRNASAGDWRGNEENAFQESIEEMVGQPEFESVEAFANMKLDNEEFSFNAVELQALARVADANDLGHDVFAANPATVKSIKDELTTDFGFTFVAREPVKFARGSMSSGHGSHPFANSGGGGSGMSGGMTSFGGGPGAVGGSYAWDGSDQKNLPMGSKRRNR